MSLGLRWLGRVHVRLVVFPGEGSTHRLWSKQRHGAHSDETEQNVANESVPLLSSQCQCETRPSCPVGNQPLPHLPRRKRSQRNERLSFPANPSRSGPGLRGVLANRLGNALQTLHPLR